jgi:hypothetical protein
VGAVLAEGAVCAQVREAKAKQARVAKTAVTDFFMNIFMNVFMNYARKD